MGVFLRILSFSLPVAQLNGSRRKSLCTKMLCPQEAEQPWSPLCIGEPPPPPPQQSSSLGCLGSRSPLTRLLPPLPCRPRLQAPWWGLSQVHLPWGWMLMAPPGLFCREAALGRGSTVGARKPSEPGGCPGGIAPLPTHS